VLAADHDPDTEGIVVDLAGGTGHYLSAVLDVSPHRHGLCVEASTPALRRAARAHSRAAAIGADAWSPLPVRIVRLTDKWDESPVVEPAGQNCRTVIVGDVAGPFTRLSASIPRAGARAASELIQRLIHRTPL
jgi:hypothetical protein